jgi:hypothetical protein
VAPGQPLLDEPPKGVETTLFTSLPGLAWLLLDKRLAEPATKSVTAKPAKPAEATGRER